jgi:hypothetical protein
MTRLGFSMCVALGLAACGNDVPGTVDAAPFADAIPADQRLLPMAVGNSWTYNVTEMPKTDAGLDGDGGVIDMPDGGPLVHVKTSTVQAFEDVGGTKAGTMAFRVRTENIGGVTVSWQEDTGNAIVRHREQSFNLSEVMESDQFYLPSKLRVDELPTHLTLNATWTTAYTEVETTPTGGTKTTAKVETWTVEAVDEPVTVPAGTFTCIRIRRVGSDATQAEKTFWYAPGVGKIKETGNQTEELTAKTIQ